MQYPRLDLFGFDEIPKIFAQIPACAAGDVHLAMIFVMAVGALPLVVVIDDDLAVPTADMAIITLGIEFGILDIVIDKFAGVG